MVDVVCIASWNTDLILRVARPLARGETALGHDFERAPGGKGSNAAIACARQGAATALIARIGDDPFGRDGLALWAREGIATDAVVVAKGETSGVALIWVYDDGDNSIAVAPGAGAGLTVADIEARADLIRSAKLVMASCEVPLAATSAAFRIAREAGVTTLLNPAPAQPLIEFADGGALLGLCDIVTPNEAELLALVARFGAGPAVAYAEDSNATDALRDAAAVLLNCGVAAVAVTLGEAGCALFRRSEAPLSLAGHRVDVVDTIGAGDTFTGALAAAMARGETLAEAVGQANAAAAQAVTGRGAIAAMPRRQVLADDLGVGRDVST
jgi:ribokinase